MRELSERQRIALLYLDDKLWASPLNVGRAIYHEQKSRGGSNLPAIGAMVLRALRKRGLVTKLPDNGLWRILPAGRAALSHKEP